VIIGSVFEYIECTVLSKQSDRKLVEVSVEDSKSGTHHPKFAAMYELKEYMIYSFQARSFTDW
jgi:hypothetical protein